MFAAPGDSLLGITLVQNKTGNALSVPMQIVLLLTALTLLPAILMCGDAVPAHGRRAAFSAAGAGDADRSVESGAGRAGAVPLALVVAAGGEEVYHQGWEPLERGEISASAGVGSGRGSDQDISVEIRPRKRHPAVRGIVAFARAVQAVRRSVERAGAGVCVERAENAFQIGAVLFLPFLIIDLVVASVTVSVGMVQLPPVMVSAPFKILLFVLVDGWNLVMGSLARSFNYMTTARWWI